MKDLGLLKYCLGMEIQQQAGRLLVNQAKYIRDILRRFGMLTAGRTDVPMEPKLKLTSEMAPATIAEQNQSAAFPYREIVGSLMYLMTSTRPDLAFAVGKLARFMNCHGPAHHAAANHVLRYIASTPTRGLIYKRMSQPHLVGFSDSDYAGDIDNRRSTSGYLFMLSGAAITWKSTLQSTVALSTAEAEYMGLTDAAKEAIYLRNLLSDFGLSPTSPVLVYGDNQSSIAISKNPINHSAMKHVHVKHHFVREKVEDGDIELRYIPTAEMLADAMTKPLAKQVLLPLRDQFMGRIDC